MYLTSLRNLVLPLGLGASIMLAVPPQAAQAQSATETAEESPTLEQLPFRKRLKLARAGDVEAQLSIARSYETGAGVRRSVFKAARWYRRAVQQNNVEAQYKLARILHAGAKGIKKAPHLAVTLYDAAARQDHVDAQYWLAYSHHHGEGTKEDPAKAAKWYQKAADAGNATAQNSLGLLYLNGKGLARDLAKAFELFAKAAENGNAWAMNNVAGMYEMGWGTQKNADKAIDFYERAAAKEISHAEDNLKRLRRQIAKAESRKKPDGKAAAPEAESSSADTAPDAINFKKRNDDGA